MRIRGTAVAVAASIIGASAATATLDSIDIGRDEGVYSLRAETHLDAKPESIVNVLLDYERFGRISSVYKEYGYLDPLPDGTPIVYTRMEGCLLKIFCKSMTRVEALEVEAPNHIRTVTLPDRSDFKRSISDWMLEPEGEGTRMTYSLEMEPDFFVPPVVGPIILKRTLKQGGGRAIDRIELLAQAVESGRTLDTLEDVEATRQGR
jgi:Polyketide cyclase / dehydrase and lipid transport